MPDPNATSNAATGFVPDPKPSYRTCMAVCGQSKPCGNRHCSLHPKHHQVRNKGNPKKS